MLVECLLTVNLANISSYEVDDEVLSSLREYALANNLFWAMAEGHACEISARRNAMENASKNAGEMINKYVEPVSLEDSTILTTL
jgi:F0F1-type ATP synthase gamma subunit